MSKKVKKVKKPFELVLWAKMESVRFATREEAEVRCVSKGFTRSAIHANEFLGKDGLLNVTILSTAEG